MNTTKISKFLLITLGSILLLAIVAAVALVIWVHPNNYKPLIIKEVKVKTGRDLALMGDISWKLFPNIGLHIGRASLSNPQGFVKAAPNFMEIEGIDVTIQLKPLLHKNIIIDRVIINGLNLNLIKSEVTKINNWTFENGVFENGAFKSKESSTNTKDNNLNHEEAQAPLAFKFSELVLHKATVTCLDYSANNFKTSKQIKNFNAKVSVLKDGKIDLNQQAGIVNLENVVLNFDDIIKGTLNLKITNFKDYAYIGNISIDQFSLNDLLAKLSYAKPNINNKNLLNKVTLKTNFTGTKNGFNAPNVKLKISDLLIKANLRASSITPLYLNNQISLDKIDLSELVNTNGFFVPMHDLKVSGNIGPNGINQSVVIQDVTLLGFDLSELMHKLDQIVTSTGVVATSNNVMDQVNGGVRIINLVKNMQDILSQAKKSGNKDLSKKTDLGKFTSNLTIKNRVVNPSSFVLNGPSTKINGNGSVNFNNKTLNYKIVSQITAPQQNKMLNVIVFPYYMHGNLSDPEGSLDWESIQKQMISYYIANNRDMIQKTVSETINKQLKGTSENIQKGVQNLVNDIFK